VYLEFRADVKERITESEMRGKVIRERMSMFFCIFFFWGGEVYRGLLHGRGYIYFFTVKGRHDDR
jgi:hypothetical protein